MGGMNPEHEPWLYENVGRASEPSDPWRDYINGMEAQSAPMRVSGGAAVGQPPSVVGVNPPPLWLEWVPITKGELRKLRDDKTKLETDLAYERYRGVLLRQELAALMAKQLSVASEQALAQPRQPLSAGWHSLPDIAAPEGRKAMPARALRPPKDGHPMPWLE